MVRLNFLRLDILNKNIPNNKYYNLNNLKTVISYALYGNATGYIQGLVKNCEIINKVFPTFWIYIYVGNDFDHIILESLNSFSNIKIIKTEISGHKNMAMRFTTIDYNEVGIAFSRDADSYINRRDIYCINKFLESDKKFQIIRDNLSHYTQILGGMWAIKRGLLSFKITDKLIEYYKNITPIYGTDQNFLGDIIYPVVKSDSQVFDEFFHFPGENPEKINTGIPWTSYTHVGASTWMDRALE